MANASSKTELEYEFKRGPRTATEAELERDFEDTKRRRTEAKDINTPMAEDKWKQFNASVRALREFAEKNPLYSRPRTYYDAANNKVQMPGYRKRYTWGGSGAYYRRRGAFRRRFGGYRRRFGGYKRRRRWYGRGGYFASRIGDLAGWGGKAISPLVKWLGGVDRSDEWREAAKKWGIGLEKAAFNKYMGSGAYNKVATGPNERLEQEVPEFATPGAEEGCVTVVNREYLGDILSNTTFGIEVAIALNPGMAESFPWLSQVAKNFCQYKFQSLMFTFKSTSGALSTTQALGEIIGAANYNVYEAAFTNKQQMLNEVFSQSKVPSEDALFPIECDPNQTTGQGLLYVRGGPTSSGDQRLYDLGTFYLATNGQASANVTLGELWVSYAVKLYKPQLPNSTVSGTNLTIISNTAYTDAAPLGTGTQTVTQNDLGVTVTGTTITFPELASGTYLIWVYWIGSSVATTVGSQSTSSAMTLAGNLGIPAAGETVTRAAWVSRITILPHGDAQVLTFGSATLPTSGTSVVINILGGL